MALEQFRAIERLRKRFAYSVIEKEFALLIPVYSYSAIAPPDSATRKTVAAPSLRTCGDSISTEQLLQCSIRLYILAGCKLRNQINTSDNGSIAAFNFKFS